MSTSSSSSQSDSPSTTDGPAATAIAVQPEPPARAGLLLVTTLFAVSALNYAFGLALAWLLRPDEYGLVGVLQALLLFAAMVLNSGFPWTLARSMSRSALGPGPLAAAPVFRTSLVGNTLLAAGLIGLIAIGQATGSLDLGPGAAAIAIGAVTIPLFGLNAVGRAALHGSLRFGRLALAKSSEVAVKVAVGLGLVALGWGIDAVAVGFLAGAVVTLVTLVWFTRGISPGWGPAASLATFRETAPIFAGTLGLAFLLSADLVALKGVVPAGIAAASVLGFYQAASMLARLPYFVGDSLMDAVYPHIARRHRSPAHSHAYFSAAVRWITLALVPVELVLILAPEPILDLLLPVAYLDAAPLVRILAFGSIAALGTGLFGKALQAVDASGLAAAGTLLGVAVELPLLALLVPALGAPGAAIAFAAGSWAAAISLAVAYGRRQGQLLPAGSRLLRYALAVSATAPLLVAASGRAWPQGLALIVAALAAYAVVIRLLDLVQAGELRRLLVDAFRLAIPQRRTS